MEKVIAVQNLSHRFGWTWALRDIAFSASAGECMAVLGPNASGKTTLLKILATRLRPTSGVVFILGHSLNDGLSPIRQQVEWLGPELALYQRLSAKENLDFHFRLRGERPDAQKVAAALEKVGLASEAQKLVASFSSGQRKRLALARILLNHPKIILLDEPHAHLDERGKKLFNDLIAEWKREGTTLLIASHDREEIASSSDQMINLCNS